MRAVFFVAAFALLVSTVSAMPRVGDTLSGVSVNDLAGTRHTEQDIDGWTVAIAMTDKDAGDATSAWFHALHDRVVARRAKMLTFVAVELFPLVLTSTVLSRARDATPRARWGSVWFCRDGTFAQQLGLPSSETPYVMVLSPSRRIVELVHTEVDDAGVARVMAALERDR